MKLMNLCLSSLWRAFCRHTALMECADISAIYPTCFFAIQQQWHIELIVSEVSLRVLKAYWGVETKLR